MKSLPILLNKIKTGCLTKTSVFEIKFSKKWVYILNLLYKEGFIQNYFIKKNKIFIYLRFFEGKTNIQQIKTFSHSKNFVYLKKKDLWLFSRYNGILFLSTIKGLKTHEECLNEQIGGKALFFVS